MYFLGNSSTEPVDISTSKCAGVNVTSYGGYLATFVVKGRKAGICDGVPSTEV